MANNQDALDAIKDVKQAVAEYGSDIKIVTITYGAYDPRTGGESETRTEQPTKAIISSVSSNENLNNLVEKYELSMKIDTTYPVDENTIINYEGKDYKIPPKGFSKKVLQNTTIIYEIVVVANSV